MTSTMMNNEPASLVASKSLVLRVVCTDDISEEAEQHLEGHDGENGPSKGAVVACFIGLGADDDDADNGEDACDCLQELRLRNRLLEPFYVI